MYVVEGTYPYITSVPPVYIWGTKIVPIKYCNNISLHSVTLEKVLTVGGFGYPPVALGLTVGVP